MAGVTILGSESVMIPHPAGLILGLIGIGFLFLSIAFGVIFREKYGFILMIILASIGTIVAFGGIGWANINKVEDYVKYDVLVSENVIFQEFYNKYEILDAKGQIYTVKEIEVE